MRNTATSLPLITALALSFCLAGCVHVTSTATPAPAATTLPKGYTIAEIAVNDPVAYRVYVAAVTPLVPKFGGVYLVRGGTASAKEGAPPNGRIVVLEFPSFAAAQAFYDSPAYQAIIGLRHKSATTRAFLVEGAAGPK